MTAPMRMFPRGDRLPKPEEMLEAPVDAKTRSARAWRELRLLLRGHRRYIAVGVLLTLVSRLAGLVLPASSKYFIDHVLVERRTDLLLPLAGIVVVATIVQAATGYALSLVLGAAAQRAVAEMRRKLAAHVLRLPVETFDATQTGVLSSRIMSDPDGIRNLLGSGFVQLLGALVTATAALGVLFWIDWRITSIMLLFLAAIGLGVAFAFARLRPINRERSWEFARVTGRLNEALGGIRVLKAYVAERRQDLIFTRGVHRMLRLVVVTLSGWAAVGALTSLAVGAIGATLILAGGRAVLSGSLTLGDLAMYALFTGLVAAPLIQVAQVGTQLSDAIAGLERARELLDQPTEDDRAPSGEPSARLDGAVEMEDVSFEYRAGVPALRNVSFAVPAGSTTALVGPSGSGKSTLLGLLAAFQRPTTGRIRIDGSPITAFDLRRYRAQLGLVLQDTFLFDGTILENISYSRPDATLAEVQRVARVAHCDEFIDRMPERYETVVGERGVKLSGGQRQRVAIARAFLADPRILILDDATSSVDASTEQEIKAALREVMAGRTTLVIAHRLSTISLADEIVVLEDGALLAHGTHDELLEASELYREIVEKGLPDQVFLTRNPIEREVAGF